MIITADIWDKCSTINGKDPAFISKHFIEQNGNDDRILFFFDGVLSRIEYLDESFLDIQAKAVLLDLLNKGFSRNGALMEAALSKVKREFEESERLAHDALELSQLRADIDYLLIMGGMS